MKGKTHRKTAGRVVMLTGCFLTGAAGGLVVGESTKVAENAAPDLRRAARHPGESAGARESADGNAKGSPARDLSKRLVDRLDADVTTLGSLVVALGAEEDPERWVDGLAELVEAMRKSDSQRAGWLWVVYLGSLEGTPKDDLFARLSANFDRVETLLRPLNLPASGPALSDVASMVIQRFSGTGRLDDLAVKMETAPAGFRNEVFVSQTSSGAADHYPAQLDYLDAVPPRLQKQVDLETIRKLRSGNVISALDFTLNHSRGIELSDGETMNVVHDATFHEDPDRYFELIRNAPPSPARDIVIKELVRAMGGPSSEGAGEWIGMIGDAGLRESLKVK